MASWAMTRKGEEWKSGAMAKYRVDLISNGMEEDGSEKAELWRERQRKGEAMGASARAMHRSDQRGHSEGLRRHGVAG